MMQHQSFSFRDHVNVPSSQDSSDETGIELDLDSVSSSSSDFDDDFFDKREIIV